MASFRETAVVTALLAGATLGVMEIDQSVTDHKLDRINTCNQLASNAVKNCVDATNTNYETQGFVLGGLEIAGLLGAAAMGYTSYKIASRNDANPRPAPSTPSVMGAES